MAWFSVIVRLSDLIFDFKLSIIKMVKRLVCPDYSYWLQLSTVVGWMAGGGVISYSEEGKTCKDKSHLSNRLFVERFTWSF